MAQGSVGSRVGALGPGWRFNTEIRDAEGKVGDIDALHLGTRIVVELDGEKFNGPGEVPGRPNARSATGGAGYRVLRSLGAT